MTLRENNRSYGVGVCSTTTTKGKGKVERARGEENVGDGGCGGAATREVAFSQPPAQRTNERISMPAPVTTPRNGPRGHDLESLDEHSREASSYVWRVLLYLTFVNPFLCLLNATCTAMVLLVSIFTFPIRASFLSPDARFLSRGARAGLAFLLLLHLRFVYAYQDKPRRCTLPVAEDFAARRLVLVHLLGPLLAPVFSVCAGVLLLLWVYTEVLLGERNDGDGAEYRGVVFVKERWEEYMLNGLKPKCIDGDAS